MITQWILFQNRLIFERIAWRAFEKKYLLLWHSAWEGRRTVAFETVFHCILTRFFKLLNQITNLAVCSNAFWVLNKDRSHTWSFFSSVNWLFSYFRLIFNYKAKVIIIRRKLRLSPRKNNLNIDVNLICKHLDFGDWKLLYHLLRYVPALHSVF